MDPIPRNTDLCAFGKEVVRGRCRRSLPKEKADSNITIEPSVSGIRLTNNQQGNVDWSGCNILEVPDETHFGGR